MPLERHWQYRMKKLKNKNTNNCPNIFLRKYDRNTHDNYNSSFCNGHTTLAYICDYLPLLPSVFPSISASIAADLFIFIFIFSKEFLIPSFSKGKCHLFSCLYCVGTCTVCTAVTGRSMFFLGDDCERNLEF